MLPSASEGLAPPNNYEFLTTSDNYDFLLGDVTSVNCAAVLDLAVTSAKVQLESFVIDEEFIDKMNLAFGNDWYPQEANALIQDLVSGKAMPKIEILPAASLKANGAFGENTIYIAKELLAKNVANPEFVSSVLLEEIGHYVDQELKSVDSLGDEGNIFAKLVQDETIGGAELEALKSKDDSANIILRGEEITVEQAAPQYSGSPLIYKPESSLKYDVHVEQWQQRMKERGWTIDVDGLYGSNSEQVARAFQREKGLTVDGIVGLDTWEATFRTDNVTGSISAALRYPGSPLKYEPGSPLKYDVDVEHWQQRMKERGWNIDVDGLYGSNSEQVARAFQREKGLTVDGIVGPETWTKTFRTDNVTPPDVIAPIPGEMTPPNSSPSGKSINSAGLNLVEQFEGYAKKLGDGTNRVKAYRDPGGVLTIGFGHTGPDVTEGKIISRAEAEQLLRNDLREAEAAVSRLVTVTLNDNQFSALVSFVFNLGAGAFKQSTMLKLLNQSKYQEAADQFPRWNKDNGQPLPGLTRRRRAERQLFLS